MPANLKEVPPRLLPGGVVASAVRVEQPAGCWATQHTDRLSWPGPWARQVLGATGAAVPWPDPPTPCTRPSCATKSVPGAGARTRSTPALSGSAGSPGYARPASGKRRPPLSSPPPTTMRGPDAAGCITRTSVSAHHGQFRSISSRANLTRPRTKLSVVGQFELPRFEIPARMKLCLSGQGSPRTSTGSRQRL